MKLSIISLLTLIIVSCSNVKMTLDCEFVQIIPEDHPDWMKNLKRDSQFIWYKNQNHLQSNSGSVTPYRSENDFNVIFERYFPGGEKYRTVTFNKIKNTVLIEERKLSGMMEFSLFYRCEKI